MNRSKRLALLSILSIAAAIGVFCMDRIAQDPLYHNFADQRAFLGVPNTFDVLSNLPFLFAGLGASWFLLFRRDLIVLSDDRERWPFLVFFVGAAFVSLGSGWYHLAPNNERLFWDRLPMSIGFMGIVAAVLAERISVGIGLKSLPILLCLGLGSVLYWHITEQRGTGDLRPYAYVQFFSLLLIPLLLWLFPPRYTRTWDYFAVLGFYVAAKIAEYLDRSIFELGQIVSGHTIKHLLAGFGVIWLFRMLVKRRPISAQPISQ